MAYKKIKYTYLTGAKIPIESEGLRVNIKCQGHVIETAAEYRQCFLEGKPLIVYQWCFTLLKSGEYLFSLDKLKDIDKQFEAILKQKGADYLTDILNRPSIEELKKDIQF